MTTLPPPESPTAALDPQWSVSVLASAGSGKTWLLVSRVLRLLLAGVPAGGIVALTFTRKAAAEMRLRLNERLLQLAREPLPQVQEDLRKLGLPADVATVERARALYRELLFTPYPPRAMTLHAFCQDLLNRFALEAGVSPGFRLLEDELELHALAWWRLQARLLREPDAPAAQALRALVELGHGEYALQQLVASFLARRGDWWAYTEIPAGPEPSPAADPVQFATERLRRQLGDCDLEQAAREVDAGAFTARLKMLRNYLAQMEGTRYLKPERLERALALSGMARFDTLEQALFTQTGSAYSIAPNEAALRKLKGGEREHFLHTHGEIVHEFAGLRRRVHAGETLRRSAAVFALGAAALRALAEELAREAALGFTELEWHAYRLLRREGAAEWVRYKLDRAIDHLLIDEFQDTSPTQWRMLLPLLEEMAAGDAGRGRSLFIVGDAKQSIYGFRRADPRLLERASAWMGAHLHARVEPLHQSRRSAPAVIDFVNALFAPEDLRGALGFEPHGTHRGDDWGRVEVAPPIGQDEANGEAPAPFRDPLAQPRRGREDQRAEREAALVATRIRALVESHVEIRAGHGPRRAIGYGDILVLARNRTHLHCLERRLTAEGIPFLGAARGTLLETSEAGDLTALLRVLDAPHRDLELARVLRSPLFGIGDDALIRIARAVRARGGTWLEAMVALAPGEPALARPLELITRWRERAARLPAHDLLDRVLCESGAARRYESALPPVTAARARANLGAFLQLALEADSGRYPSLPRFLRYLEAQARAAREAPDEAPPAAADPQVRILTVHAAKGLEAPAVFIVNAGRLLAPRTPRLLVEWPEHEERPTHVAAAGGAARRDALTEALAEAHKTREAREDLNLLYVAATRARQFLHISGFRQINAGQRLSWHDHALRALESMAAASALPGTAAGSLCHATGKPAPGRTHAPPPALPPPDPRLRQPIELPAGLGLPPSARVERDEAAGLDAQTADRGTAIHFLLQRLSENGNDEEILWAGLRPRLTEEPPREEFRRWLETARSLLREPSLARFFDRSRYRRAWNEVPVTVDGAGAFIDRLVDDGDGLWVLDYKTHARPDAAALAERYRGQIAAYVEAVRLTWPGRPVRGGLILTASRTWMPVTPF